MASPRAVHSLVAHPRQPEREATSWPPLREVETGRDLSFSSLRRGSQGGVVDDRCSIERVVIIVIAMVAIVMPPPARAQQPKAAEAKAASVFDDDEKEKEKKPGETKSAGAAKPAAVSDRDSIGFTQENVASQMTELEERMFRLSEALASLEPENASRLRLALKFSREEQILEQMRETHKLLKDTQLTKAETETKELIAKLEHLRNLLLAEDLDFQLKLARLRQMRETLGQLERIVKEERRELGWSRFAAEQRKRLSRFTTRRPDLEAIVRDQQAVFADTKNTSKTGNASAKEARAAIRQREVKIRNAATALATDPLFADLQPPHLRRADAHLAEAASSLEGVDVNAAVAAEDKALGLMREELTRLDEQVTQTERTIAEAEFRRRAGDQAKNRGMTESLEATSARLGDVGVGLRKDLIRAGASMRSAEQDLGKSADGPAADDQSTALDVLAKSRDEFTRSIERLLVELRVELQNRLVADMTEMHVLQSSIRETTQAQAPRVLQKSRTALIAVAGLSKTESELGERTENLLALVEETEYGIALPTTLRILSREMRSIGGWLKAGDVASRTVDMETRIEENLLGLAEAVRRLSPTTPPPPGTPLSLDARERERELNRLVAELKMVRMLQARLNDDTVVVDKTRRGASISPTAIRREVETLELTQDEIRDALAKIAERLPVPDLSSE
jgi:hypothetical protein